MRNLKKFLALVLAFMMAMSLMVTVNAANVTFTDSEEITAEFQDDITILAGMGVIKGQGNGEDGLFTPQRNVTRAEMAAIVYRLHTGDVNDTRVDLYKGSADFIDVPSTEWFAGYIGYCNSAQIIVGDGNGYFRPNDPVTGYEALAMLLRAMGYDQNREFSTSTIPWQVQVAQIATSRGLLSKTDKTTYRDKNLSEIATREFATEVAFQAATRPTVQYTAAFGYQIYPLNGIMLGTTPNPTLAETYFGLTSIEGIVVGNQATGEDFTLIGVEAEGILNTEKKLVGYELGDASYKYESTNKNTTPINSSNTSGNVTLSFKEETGLSLFGHKVEIWYNSRSTQGNADFGGSSTTLKVPSEFATTYAVFDRAVDTEYVYASDNTKVGEVADIKDADNVWLSDRYSQMEQVNGSATDNLSPISTYALIYNDSAKSVDVVISLSAEAAQITQVNSTAKDPWLALGSNTSNASTFGDGTTAGKILTKQLTSDSVDVLVGRLVIAYEIAGTGETLSSAQSKVTNGDPDFMYQLESPKTRTATVATYVADSGATIDSQNPVVTKLNLVGGDTMEVSGITLGDGSNSEIISNVLPVVGSLNANTTYTIYEDKVGRFISLSTDSDSVFLYGTYAGYQLDGFNAGTIEYNVVGVDWNGAKQVNNPLKQVSGTDITGALYNNLTVTRMDYGNADNATTGNEVRAGYDTGYIYTPSTGNLVPYTGLKMQNSDADWTITNSDVANGFKKVSSNGVEYLLTKDTNFIVVSGTGSATLKAVVYNGLANFLNGASEAKISYSTGHNEVIFRTEAEMYGTVNTADNGVITDVILSEDNLLSWSSQNLFYNYDQTADTGMVLPGADPAVKQYELWNNGESGYYFIDTSANDDPANAQDTFYTLAKIDEQNGMPIYMATAQSTTDGLNYTDGYNTSEDNDLTYEYVTVSNLHTGLFEKNGQQLVFNLDNAVVCDVEYKTGASTNRSEITSIAELNNAVSVKNVNPSSAVYGIQVSVVYDGANMALIYVTSVT